MTVNNYIIIEYKNLNIVMVYKENINNLEERIEALRRFL